MAKPVKPTPVRRGDRVVEVKVRVASTVATLSGLVMSALATYVFGGDVPGAVGQVVSLVIGAVVPGLLTFASGWLAKHTPLNLTLTEKHM